ncbi:hypothetical protein DL89DRAFT_256108 [Linderina pennispora]|uniref:Uncharacterized protein n=1 Tax=Linderina pennispora TaxID=61395 RepID=A0A1Y1WGL9_9FUNG|nr:uncharacterized protein DL89DRAFT_256108 [Linderina pennispora]ORX72488.1 hypothetical protein DL89DRAFT_256108 [Linderina pennispora]
MGIRSDAQRRAVAANRQRPNPGTASSANFCAPANGPKQPLPRDLRLRIKPKLHPTTGRPQLTVDELEGHSRVATKSTYLPISARHLHQALNDPLCYRMASGIGAVRPDIVEHAGKVLQLRILSAMHRMHLQFSQHANPPAPLVIPEKGTTFGQPRSRLDVIRMEVDGRVQRQDARWQCMYPLVELPQSHSIDCVLPAAGLQCIVRLPPPLPYTRLAISDQPLSVSSEAMAKKVWKTLRKMHGNYEPIEYDVLAQIDWLAVQIAGRPEPHNEPTLSMQALEQLYHWLPVLTPGLHVDGPVNHKGKRGKKLRAIDKQPENAWPRPFRSETQLTYQFSLAEPGLKYAHVDGARTKAVPVKGSAG